MTIINTSPDRIIQLGYEGEDRVTVLRFRYSADWLENGEGIFNIRIRRHGENHAYNAELLTVDLTHMELLMTITNVELSVKGSGEMQVVYSGEDFVKKSPIYSYNVSRAVDEAVDPPAQDVYTEIIESLSGLHDTVWDIDRAVAETDARVGNLTDLTTEAKTDLVSAINEVNEHGGASVTVDSELSTTSTNPVQNKVVTSAVQSKADIQTVSALADAVQDLDGDVQGLHTAVQGKADMQTVTALSGTVSGLQTSKADKSYVDTQLVSKIGDVQVNGTSIVSDGIANVPIASSSNLGVLKCSPSFGINARADGYLNVVSANSTAIKNGNATYLPVTTISQHESVFYGLAKVAGYDEKDSTLAVGEYTDEAKIAIQNMFDVPSTATVSTLSDAVQDLDSDVHGLQITVQSKADTSTVTALSETVSGLQTVVQSKADAQMVTALSGTVTGLQTTKADKSYVDTELASKASTATATASSDGLMSAQDKSRLDAVYADYSSALTALGVIE